MHLIAVKVERISRMTSLQRFTAKNAQECCIFEFLNPAKHTLLLNEFICPSFSTDNFFGHLWVFHTLKKIVSDHYRSKMSVHFHSAQHFWTWWFLCLIKGIIQHKIYIQPAPAMTTGQLTDYKINIFTFYSLVYCQTWYKT